MVDTMLKTETSPVKGALEQLSVSDLKSISCSLEGTDDKMVIKRWTPTWTSWWKPC